MRQELLTVQEAAEVLKVCDATVRTRIREGKIDAFKTGRAWRIINRDEWYKDNGHKKGE